MATVTCVVTPATCVAEVRPAMLTITPRAIAEPSFLSDKFTKLGNPGIRFMADEELVKEELANEETLDNEDNGGEYETRSSITFPVIVNGTAIISDLKIFPLSSVTLTYPSL